MGVGVTIGPAVSETHNDSVLYTIMTHNDSVSYTIMTHNDSVSYTITMTVFYTMYTISSANSCSEKNTQKNNSG